MLLVCMMYMYNRNFTSLREKLKQNLCVFLNILLFCKVDDNTKESYHRPPKAFCPPISMRRITFDLCKKH